MFNADVTKVSSSDAKPGSIIRVDKDAFTVMTGKDALTINDIQIEGKRRMAVKEFLLGYALNEGDVLSD